MATIGYVDAISKASIEEAVIVLDDIRWSDGMTRAWEFVGERTDVGFAIDLETMGILIRRNGRRKLSLTL